MTHGQLISNFRKSGVLISHLFVVSIAANYGLTGILAYAVGIANDVADGNSHEDYPCDKADACARHLGQTGNFLTDQGIERLDRGRNGTGAGRYIHSCNCHDGVKFQLLTYHYHYGCKRKGYVIACAHGTERRHHDAYCGQYDLIVAFGLLDEPCYCGLDSTGVLKHLECAANHEYQEDSAGTLAHALKEAIEEVHYAGRIAFNVMIGSGDNGLAVFREIVGTCGQYVGKEYHQYDQCGKYYIRTGHFKVFLLLFSGFHIPSKNFSCVIWPL